MRELEQPDDGVDIRAILDEADDRRSLLGLWADEQAAQADQLLAQAASLEHDSGGFTNAHVGVVQPLEKHIFGQERWALGERDKGLATDIDAIVVFKVGQGR